MTPEKLNFKLIGVFLLLMTLSVLLILNKEPTMLLVKSVLEWKQLNATLWLGFFSCFIVHYLSIKKETGYVGGLIFSHFGKFADTAFAIITYGLASTTSAAILKGVYVQQFFGERVYFQNFDQIDIYSMLVVCIFLLGYSLYAAFAALKNAVILSKSETAIPVNE
ncbi:hypothetical protein B5G52_06165 [Pseudoalteromonas sp. A601]|uniref:hypothetical protein n=1 Tax=Pseudoalteromonas sp. A601 TaxID=1967839 RepID=UPI000B3C3F5B|nr:hypothetical protein [Pseudoalteromonas sp. A601]OUS72776.1 hypothetical protein B5G52_06165 [Pseudoalteromonas sp. A601]